MPGGSAADSSFESDGEGTSPVKKARMQLVIPPKRPLSIDILLYTTGFLWRSTDLGTLNSIRQTSWTVYRSVEKQVVYTHNDHEFRDHTRLQKLCALLMRSPSENLPLLHTLNLSSCYTGFPWDEEQDRYCACPCGCSSRLLQVVQESRALRTIIFAKAEWFFRAEPAFKTAVARSPSLRKLVMQNGVGPATFEMFQMMQPGVTELDISFLDHNCWESDMEDVEVSFLESIRGLSSSLNTLTVASGDRLLLVSLTEPELVWPNMHTLEIHALRPEWPELFKAFPNLRNLTQRHVEHSRSTSQRSRLRSQRHSELCWHGLDSVDLCINCLWTVALVCPVRRLKVGALSSDEHAEMLLDDLAFMLPVVLELWIAIRRETRNGRSEEMSIGCATRILQSLPRVKTLELHVGCPPELTPEFVDNYMTELLASFRTPQLAFLRLHLRIWPGNSTRRRVLPNSDSEEHRSPSPYPSGPYFTEQSADEAQREVLLSLSVSIRSLRYVHINAWHDGWSGGRFWEVVRPGSDTDSVQLRCLEQVEGEKLWARYQDES